MTGQRPFLASAAAWLMVSGRWRTVAASAAALLLVGWIGLYQMGVQVWVPWAEQPDSPSDKAKAAADAEAQRRAAEAEQQRLKEEAQRQAKAAADAEEKRKAAEAEQQRLAAVRAEEARNKAAAEAEARRKAEEAQRKASTQPSQFTIRTDTEAHGAVQLFTAYDIRSISECEKKCSESASCKIFSYNKKIGWCFAYDNAALAPNEFYDSGIRK